MNILMGYNFLSDGNSLDPYVREVDNITNVKLQNGIYTHFNVTKDVTTAYDTTIPTAWSSQTIMDCNFNGNINAGSLSDITANVTQIKIKRREYGTYDWVVVKVIDVVDESSFTFAFADYLVLGNKKYEYAFVPVTSGSEGGYITTLIDTEFRGLFICDADTAYRFYGDIEYGNTTTVQRIGTFEPYGRKFPVIVANAMTSYQSGSFSGDILPPSFYSDPERQIDRQAIVEERNLTMAFLTNHRAKIIKDQNGNAWLVCIVGSPTTSYNNAYGQGFVKAAASWMEIGEADKAADLYNAGLVPVQS